MTDGPFLKTSTDDMALKKQTKKNILLDMESESFASHDTLDSKIIIFEGKNDSLGI